MITNSSANTKKQSHLNRWPVFALILINLIFVTGCQETGMMRIQPYNRPLSGSDFFPDGASARKLVDGTVPQTEQRVDDPALTGKTDNGDFVTSIPVQVTSDLVQRGQERFGIYCEVCHGIDGHGDGKVVTGFGFPTPPDLLTDILTNTVDGDLFNTITNGHGIMLSYGYRVKAPDRWAVIAYLRAMQLNGGHLTQELTPAELQQLGTK
jgi:mono/diheme cytochrome c family protein